MAMAGQQTQDDLGVMAARPLRRARRKPLNILLVEDSASDAELTRLALDGAGIPYTLERLEKGTDVVPYLLHRGYFADESVPDLILLDLGLPCENGFEVLESIASMRGATRGIPIVILTGYEHFSYLKRSQALCIADYLTKPCCSDRLRRVMAQVARQ